jgi:hypothetical protein
MVRCQPTGSVPSTSGLKTKKVEVAPNLDPLENRRVACIFEEHEEILRQNYDILPTVRMFYQNSETWSINGGNITLFERIFMAGLWLPFLEITRDFILFLMVTPSQIMPNA